MLIKADKWIINTDHITAVEYIETEGAIDSPVLRISMQGFVMNVNHELHPIIYFTKEQAKTLWGFLVKNCAVVDLPEKQD